MFENVKIEIQAGSEIFHCPKGCDWAYCRAAQPGPVKDIVISSDMAADQVNDAISEAVAKRDRERDEMAERAVMQHVLHSHLAVATAANSRTVNEVISTLRSIKDDTHELYMSLNSGDEVTDYQESCAGSIRDHIETVMFQLADAVDKS